MAAIRECAGANSHLAPGFRQHSEDSDNNRRRQRHENWQVTRHDDARCCKAWIGGRSSVDVGNMDVGLVAFATSCYTARDTRAETSRCCRQPGAHVSQPNDSDEDS
jgi:hypothetical protein